MSTKIMDRPPRFNLSLNTQWLKFAISFVFVAVVGTALYGAYTWSSKSRVGNPPPTVDINSNANSTADSNPSGASKNSLRFWLTVQKMRDGKPYLPPFKSSGQEIFESGYQFRLNAESSQNGFLYIFNEGSDASWTSSLTLIYPTPATNNGSANIRARESIQTGSNVFQGQPGTEQFWIVWSQSPVAELEAAREAAFQTSNGRLVDAVMVRSVREFLIKKGEQKPLLTKDREKQETVIEGSGDLLVTYLDLEHR